METEGMQHHFLMPHPLFASWESLIESHRLNPAGIFAVKSHNPHTQYKSALSPERIMSAAAAASAACPCGVM